MDYIVLTDAGEHDGRYPFDLERQPLTTREWGWIKEHAGYTPLSISDGRDDPLLLTVFAVAALRRAGRVDAAAFGDTVEAFRDLPFGDPIAWDTSDLAAGAGDAGPPALRSTSNTATSGGDSATSSETPEPPPNPTGIPASATSVSGLVRSAS